MSNATRTFAGLSVFLISSLAVAEETEPPKRNQDAPNGESYSIREAFPPLTSAAPLSRLPHWTIYGHRVPAYPHYRRMWGTGWTAWESSGGVDGLGYWYQYHTHVPGIGVKYYRGPIATYYPAAYGVSPATGFSHYGYGPLGW